MMSPLFNLLPQKPLLCFLFFISVLSNLCRATSGGYINFGCSREVLFLRGYFQCLCVGEIFAGRDR